MLAMLKPTAKFVVNSALSVLPSEARRRFKSYHELCYWRSVIAPIAHDPRKMMHERDHYAFFYNAFFGLTAHDYDGRAILDIGCGPMGSLEWADNTRERVGLDPLAGRYATLVGREHGMHYCEAAAEAVPYPDGHFDQVSSFNNLDHVDDVEAAVREMKRVTAPKGRILLIVEIGHAPTPTEPHRLDKKSILRHFAPEFRPFSVRCFGVSDDHNLYASLKDGTHYVEGRPGVLAARFER